MNNKTLTTILIAIAAFAAGYLANNFLSGKQIKSESQVKLESAYDSLSYFLGLSIGYQSIDFNLDNIDPVLVGSGINTVLNDSSVFDRQTMQILTGQVQSRLEKQQSQAAIEEGSAFLAKNRVKDGVIETESGLQYEVLREGEGAHPADTSVVKVHYHGTLLDGTVFDSSVDRDEPVEFPLNRVIPGWTEGLQLMSVGSKYKFYIPQELAYGSRAQGQIPAYSTLVFEVELLDIIE
jgi:FKBP-type peptidyl-prolyl cis-trans isomerase FkpA